MSRFIVIWAGQVLAGCGMNIVTFSLGIWLFQASQSVTQFSLLMFFNTLPALLLAGISGRVADRYERRRTVLLAHLASALVGLVYFASFQAELAQPWLVYVLAFADGCATSFQWPAYRAWSTQLVAARHFGRIGGLSKLGEGIPFLLGPVLGGALIATTSLTVVFAINIVTRLLGAAVVLVGSRGSVQAAEAPTQESLTWQPLLKFLRERPGLVGLTVLTPLIVFTEGWVTTLFQPLMLQSFAPDDLGLMLSLAGMGLIVGALVMTAWGGPTRQIFSVLGAVFAQTLVVAFFALTQPQFWSTTAAAFAYFAAIPFLSGSNQAIWQAQTPLHLQGRMFAFRRATESAAAPLALLSAGPLVDSLLSRWLRPGAALEWVQAIVPSGAGQNIAALFLVVALVNVVVLLAATLWQPVWQVDLVSATRAERPPLTTLTAGRSA